MKAVKIPNSSMGKDQFLSYLRDHLLYLHGTVTGVAEYFGFSAQFASMMLSGKRPVPDSVLKQVGFQKIAVRSYIYVPLDEDEPLDVQNEDEAEEEQAAVKPRKDIEEKIMAVLRDYPSVTLDSMIQRMEGEEHGDVIRSLQSLLDEGLISVNTDTRRVCKRGAEHLL